MNAESQSTQAWNDQEGLRAELVPLLQEKRYEDALSLLYRARTIWPNDDELQVSIEQVKGFLVIKYARKLGGLDRIAPPLPAGSARTPEVMLLSRYINGYSSFDDLAQVSPLGRLRTLQVLVSLYTDSIPPPIDAEPSSGLRLPGEARTASNIRLKPEGDEPPETTRSVAGDSLPSVVSGPTPHPSHTAPQSGVGNITSAGSVAGPSSTQLASIFRPPPDEEYKRQYATGTTAFVQKRYSDAAEAFQACIVLRPDDQGAAVMLKRSLSELKLLG